MATLGGYGETQTYFKRPFSLDISMFVSAKGGDLIGTVIQCCRIPRFTSIPYNAAIPSGYVTALLSLVIDGFTKGDLVFIKKKIISFVCYPSTARSKSYLVLFIYLHVNSAFTLCGTFN